MLSICLCLPLSLSRDVKMCYYFEPMKEAVSVPFATGMPKSKVCNRLKKENPEICEVKYGENTTKLICCYYRRIYLQYFLIIMSLVYKALKVEKKEGEEKINYSKMKVKDLRTILDQRGTKCTGCTEKQEFVKKCEDTEHLEL
jgi:hypothetical protein